MEIWREIGIWVLVVGFFWGYFFIGQKRATSSSTNIIMEVPSWINILCGNPNSNQRLDFGCMVIQLSAVAGGILGIGSFLGALPQLMRLKLLAFWGLTQLPLYIITIVIAFIWKKAKR